MTKPKTRLAVYRQGEPIAIGATTTRTDPDTGRSASMNWHRANLTLVGYAATWAEAKLLTAAPITEVVPA